MFGGGSHGFLGGGFMWLLWIILLIVIIYIIKDLMRSTRPSTSEDDVLKILKRRYARGEIDDAEFGRRKNELDK